MITLAISMLAFVLCAFAQNADAPSRSSSGVFVDRIQVDGVINPAAADFIADSIAHAEKDGASALVIELDTPGGLLSSAQNIVKSLLNSPVPTIVYVAPSGAFAASAGTFVVEASNIAAMAPGTTIGAAHPVTMSGGAIKGPEGVKIENFMASFAESIAHQRGRNKKWVVDAVRKSVAVGETEALRLNVINIVAPDLQSLLAQASGRKVTVAGGRTITLELKGATVRTYHMRAGQELLNWLANPDIMYLLMVGGLVLLYLEFAHPGVYLPGVLGAICLMLALASFEVIPINIAGFGLIILGVAMMVAEAFVTSYGALGLGGIAAFVLGSLFLIDTSETNLQVSRTIIAGAAIGLSAIILSIGYVAIRERRVRAKTGGEGLVGEIGEVRQPIAPGVPGRILVHGENWRAVSDSPLEVGRRARITAVRGLEVVVLPESVDRPTGSGQG